MRGTLILGAVTAKRDAEFLNLLARNPNTTSHWIWLDFVKDYVESAEAKMHMAAVLAGYRTSPRDYHIGLF